MEARHARYPFLPAAREAVAEADADLVAVVEAGGPVVERARERVELAIESNRVGEPHRSTRVELLSYPVARVLVSLLDEPALTRRYASAEAGTAVERLRADGDDAAALRSVGDERLSREELLAALGLSEAVSGRGDGFDVAVGAYLRLTDDLDDDLFRLVGRVLRDGRVRVTAAELSTLLREAVRERVAEDLPLAVPPPIAEALSDDVAAIRSQLADFSVDRAIGTVEPDLFPPCVTAIAERARAGEALADHTTFAYVSFLAAIGMAPAEIEERIAALPGVDDELSGSIVDHLTERDGAAYLPPSCATMVAYGDCVNRDELCATIGHPLEYYERRLDGAEPGETQASRAESQ